MKDKWATLSTCGLYRWVLGRSWTDRPPRFALWVMLNPSTADHEQDDPTIRRCMNFGEAFGFGGILVVNLYAWRATNPRDLKGATDPVGFQNDFYIKTMAERAEMVICAWGQSGPQPGRPAAVLELLRIYAGAKIHTMGFRQNGGPRHPLMLPKETRPERAEGWQP